MVYERALYEPPLPHGPIVHLHPCVVIQGAGALHRLSLAHGQLVFAAVAIEACDGDWAILQPEVEHPGERAREDPVVPDLGGHIRAAEG
jgi:hypothetical protein